MKYLLFIITTITLVACGSTKKSTADFLPAPDWVKSRPFNTAYYTGIGITKKWGTPDNYKSDARQKALADMAGQINAKVSSTSVLHQIENKKGVSEMFSNNIKSSSLEFLEGYEEVDSYEDETYYYTYFQLSKIRFAELKNERKKNANANAMVKYNLANEEEKKDNTASAINLYITALDAMTDYLGEDNMQKVGNEQTIDVCVESVKKLHHLLNGLQIIADKKQTGGSVGDMIPADQLIFNITNENNIIQSNIPVVFKYSNGFLRKDKDMSTTDGTVNTTIHKLNANGAQQTLCATVDINTIIRNNTSNLLIRKMLDDTAGNSDCVTITIK